MTVRKLQFWFAVFGLSLLGCRAWSQTPAVPPTPPVPSKEAALSPVQYFRRLLGMKPEERDAALVGRSEAQKKILLAKLHEYEQMLPDVRELRLRHTELKWHMLELMRLDPQGRSNRLVQVAVADRPLIDERLRRWDALDPQARKLFLESQAAIATYIEGQGGNSGLGTNGSIVPVRQKRLDEELARWQALPAGQKQEMCGLFREFFELSDKERQQTLRKLTIQQRQLTEQAIQSLAKLSPEQREKRLDSLQKLVTMTATERQRFLESAQRWQSMSPEEREAWKKSVSKLPLLPPLPPGFAEKLPPMPPGLAARPTGPGELK